MQYEYRLRWDSVKYEPGELKVVAYKNGKAWATDVVKTAGAASELHLEVDRTMIAADGNDLSFITVRVSDEKGNLVATANNTIHFEVSGEGEIVATDNGNPADLVAFPSHERNALSGLALVIVKANKSKPGTIKLMASSDGLKAAEITIQSQN